MMYICVFCLPLAPAASNALTYDAAKYCVELHHDEEDSQGKLKMPTLQTIQKYKELNHIEIVIVDGLCTLRICAHFIGTW